MTLSYGAWNEWKKNVENIQLPTINLGSSQLKYVGEWRERYQKVDISKR